MVVRFHRLTFLLVALATLGVDAVSAAPSALGKPVPEVEPLGGPPPGGTPLAFIQQLRSRSHPYLFFDGSDLEALRARRSQAPWSDFYRPIKSYADDSVKIGIRKAGVGPTSGWITDRAVRTGLVYLIEGDPKYLQTVEDFIASLTQSEIDAILADYQTVHTVLHHYAMVYDFVAPDLSPATRAKLEALLTDMVERYVDNFDNWNYRPTYPALAPHFRFPTNHGTRGESGVCLAAMAMPHHADAPAWMDRCLRMLNFLFSTIAGDEGLWVEGPSYFDYGIDPFYDFAFAYHHLSGINAFSLEDPPIHPLFDAMIRIRRPDGYGPQYADSAREFTNQTTVAGMLPDGAYHMWSQDVFNAQPGDPPASQSTVMDFLFYEPVGPVEPPWGQTTFFARDQAAVFRRDFSPDSSYAFVRGFDLPFSNHEHADQASFEFFAYDTPLIVDGGYSGWQNSRNEDLTALVYPDGHNLVLVDGTGPRKDVHRENDRFVLERFAATEFLDTTDVVGDYNHTGSSPKGTQSDCVDGITGAPCNADRPPDNVTDVAVRRTFFYPKSLGPAGDREYLIVIDEAYSVAQPAARHDYTLLLHGATTDFSRNGPAYSWSTSNEAGEAITIAGYTVASGPISYATRSWYHFYPGVDDRLGHTRLAMTVEDAERVVFVTILVPFKNGTSTPTFAPIEGAGGPLGMEIGLWGVSDRIVVNLNGGRVSTAGLVTDAWATYTRHRQGVLEKAALKEGSTLEVDGRLLVEAVGSLGFLIGEIDAGGAFRVVAASDIAPSFADVLPDHPYYQEIEALYRAGYTAGCNTDPLMYCPDQTMNRAESSVFVQRGIHGTDGLPPQPAGQTFADLPLDSWAAKWAEALWQDGYTAGCGTSPLIYCPWQGHTRAEGCVFYLHMLNGASYEPPQPSQQTFADVPLEAWYAKWVQAGYEAGLITPCQTTPDLRFCPNDPLSRGLAAYMMVQAKGLQPGSVLAIGKAPQHLRAESDG